MGKRGEGWVIGQFVIALGILAASFVTRAALPFPVQVVGIMLLVLGGILIVLGLVNLGENLTPFPKPKTGQHALVTTGIYSIVRHPIYSGFFLGALGWSLWWGTLLGIVLTLVLFVWFDLKARREEAWLIEKYPDYISYKSRVKKLIPFLY